MTNHHRSRQIETRIQRLFDAITAVPVSSNVQTAWLAISDAVKAVEQGESDPWKIDPLTAKEVTKYEDGSVRVPQIGHWLYINSNGAFGIRDLWSSTLVVSKPGFDGVAFYMPI